MKQCGCRFCIQALASEQVDIPAVHGTRDGGHGAKERTDGNVPDQHRGLVRKFLLHPRAMSSTAASESHSLRVCRSERVPRRDAARRSRI